MALWRAAISLHSYTVPLVQWSTHLLPIMRDPGSIPRGVLMWNRDSPVSVVSLHWWPQQDWSLWPRLRRDSSQTVTRLSCRQCDNPTWSHTAFLSWFHARCRSSFRLHNRYSQLLGGALWRACNLTAFIHSSTHPVVHLFASHHEGLGFNPQGGTYVKPGFSCLTTAPFYGTRPTFWSASENIKEEGRHSRTIKISLKTYRTMMYSIQKSYLVGQKINKVWKFNFFTLNMGGGGGEGRGTPGKDLTIPNVCSDARWQGL